MARSGLSVSPELASKLKSYAEGKISWFSISIKGESFEEVGQGAEAGEDWVNIRDQLPDKDPLYVFFQYEKGTWLLIFWCPDRAQVKQRMMYSSSIAAVKKGFPVTWRNPSSYRCSEKDECSPAEYLRSIAAVPDEEILTAEELTRKEAHQDSITTGALSESKVSAIVGLPIKIQDAAGSALDQFAAGASQTVVCQLDMETEALGLVTSNGDSLETVGKSLTDKEPRFIVHAFKHENKEGQATTSNVFVYYCPDRAKPRLKMFYSSCKSVVGGLLASKGIEVAKAIECSEAAEVSAASVLDELYPKKHVKESFAKPTARGPRRSRAPRAKFDASKRK